MNWSFSPTQVSTLIISAEKMMYGAVFLRLERNKAGIMESYAAVADGGDVCGEGEEFYDNKSMDSILQNILSIKYPEKEDEEASCSWGVQFGDADNNQIAGIEQGFWGYDGIHSLITYMEKEIGNSEAISALKDLIDF